jgi:beta-glucosidase
MTPTATGKAFRTEEYPRGSFTTLMNTNVIGCQTVRFSTTYTPPKSGSHYLSFSGLGPSKLFINDVLVADQTKPTKDAMGFLLGVQDEIRFQYAFDSTKQYSIAIETHPSPNADAELHLLNHQCSIHVGLITAAEMEHDVLSEAIELARTADMAIVFVGNTTQWETEGQDLSTMTLPADGSQDTLISRVAAVNPNVIVVNTTGVPVETPWIDSVPAFLQAWYAGQETGNAILDVLLGETCPSGKLPISWPKKYEHTGCYGNFGLDSYDSREVEYVEGVFVGYRWFDKYWGQEKEVRWPFGFGMSYTAFELLGARLDGGLGETGEGKIEVKVTVKNIGENVGAETVQVYVCAPRVEGLDRPVKALVGFAKVALQSGEEKEVVVEFGRDGLAYWDEELGRWSVVTGEYKVLIATSSDPKDVRAKVVLDVEKSYTFGP